MKRILITTLISIAFGLFAGEASAQKKKPDCTAAHKEIKTAVECPDDEELAEKGIKACGENGCGGSVDKLLNQRKNTDQGDRNTFVDMKFSDVAEIPKCVEGYTGIGDKREPLKGAGEGKMVRVVAWALDARPQQTREDDNGEFPRGESCNCGFTGVLDVDGGPKNTDVHIVLVDDEILKLTAKAGHGKTATFNTLKKREAQSLTAEYTPRVRVKLKEAFDGAKLKELINPSKGGRLLVRITGLLMYDSEHAFTHPLVRQSNWEIHPVFRLEYCPKGKNCPAQGNTGWKDINKEP
jgi:hypothetical protein